MVTGRQYWSALLFRRTEVRERARHVGVKLATASMTKMGGELTTAHTVERVPVWIW